jgi:acetyl esterase/lipase
VRLILPATLFWLSLAAVPTAHAQGQPGIIHTEDVVYGRRFGTALTLDVFEPRHKNGAAVFYIVSGGFSSAHSDIRPERYMPFLDRGYTVFAVVHSSRPRYFIPEIEDDIHRAVRFVRHNASRWNIDPNKFGVTGTSSGGHLSLALGTQGGPGPPDTKDPVDHESSAIQAVACFFPPTDYLNWSKPNEDAVDYGATHNFEPPLGPRDISRNAQRDVERTISPINFVTASMAPTLVIQGDADELVPLYQSRAFEEKCKAAGARFKLVVKAGAGHAYAGWEKDIQVCADWFDEQLLGNGSRI